MPGYGLCQVKCEPLSEEEDSNSQCFSSYTDNQNEVSELVPVKLEPETHNDDHEPSHLLQHLQGSGGLLELEAGAPAGPAATPVRGKLEPHDLDRTTLATLQSTPNATSSSLLERHMALGAEADIAEFIPLLPVKDEPLSDGEQGCLSGDEGRGARGGGGSPKSWTQKDMDQALDALKNHNMSLTKASARFGIPSTTLWQRAHRLGIDTPKKDGGAKSWGDGDLRRALAALRAGLLSANKASKAYGIPSSTLYKIARREGIRLAAPFNAAPVSWRRADLDAALADIRRGAASVQRAAVAYGIPTGTLYGRCKREGIELSRANPTPWSEDAMGEALEAVRVGQMSINQAAIHYNLPYSSLYGRFKRCKYQPQGLPSLQDHQDPQKPHEMEPHGLDLQQYYHHPGPHIIHHMPDDSQDQGIPDHNGSHDHMNSHHTGPQNQADLLQPGSQTHLGSQDHIGLQNQVPQDHRAHEIQLREDHTHYLPHMALDPMHMVHEYSPGQSMYYASCNMAS